MRRSLYSARRPIVLLCVLFLGLAAPAVAGTGTDTYGYTWIDSDHPSGPQQYNPLPGWSNYYALPPYRAKLS